MPELVQECGYFAEREQRGALRRGRGEIGHYCHARAVVLLLTYVLRAVCCHPCAALFAFARVQVEEQHSEEGLVLVHNIIGRNASGVHGYVGIYAEPYAVQLGGEVEYAFLHLREFEIGTQHFAVDVEERQFQLVRIVCKVPWLQFEIFAFHAFGISLHLRHFFPCRVGIMFQEVAEHAIYVVLAACHAFFEHIVGKRLVAEQLCHFLPHVYYVLAYFGVAVLAFAQAHSVVCHVKGAPEFAVVAIGKHGHVHGLVKRYSPTVFAVFPCGGRCRVEHRFRHSVEHVLPDYIERELLACV